MNAILRTSITSSESTLFGTKFIRFDTFTETGEVGATQFYNPTAVYCITPVTKEVAIAFGLRNQPAPVQQWELPKPQLTVIAGTPDEFHADYSDSNHGYTILPAKYTKAEL